MDHWDRAQVVDVGDRATTTLCTNVFINGAAFLIPTLHAERGLDLAEAGLMSSLPSFGMVVTLIAWGYLVDRVGERTVLVLGSALTAAAAFAAASVHSLVAVRSFCSSAAWRPPAVTPRAVGWWSAGSRRTSADWSWASGRPPSRLGSASARW